MLNPFVTFLSGKDIWRVRFYHWKECVCCRVLWNPPKTAREMHSVFSFCFVIQLKLLTCRKLHIKVRKCLHLTKGESRCSVTFMFQLSTRQWYISLAKGGTLGDRSDLRENSCGASRMDNGRTKSVDIHRYIQATGLEPTWEPSEDYTSDVMWREFQAKLTRTQSAYRWTQITCLLKWITDNT